MIALLGERLPAALRGDADIRKCLAEAQRGDDDDPAPRARGQRATISPARCADFSSATLMRRWQAGESDVGTEPAHPLWLAPPPRRLGVVVHELRGGVAAPPR